MKVTYDAEVDVLRIVLSDHAIDESDEDKPGIIIDYDTHGNIVSMEILDASKRGISPHGVEYAITGLKGA
jgi:uncharacterized protein YuzE